MFDYRRSHTCQELTKAHEGELVTLSGWVHRRRDHGNIIFIDLRDRYGVTQIVFDPGANPQLHQMADKLRSEWVISVKGRVKLRGANMNNPKMSTGDIEIEVHELEVLSRAKTPPFSIADDTIDVSEELRLKYRYLDLRRGHIVKNLQLRHKAMRSIRDSFDKLGFLEITTPILAKSTPEGSRDYLVPSRIYPGTFYALPQSPQLFKQILMIGGLDKYFQIATCFRDEDLRADRQPEFMQIDVEMSFVTPQEIFHHIEFMISELFKECLQKALTTPFKKMTYQECQELYGTDKPDLRFGMTFHDLSPFVQNSSCPFLIEALSGGIVKGFVVPGGADIPRKNLDEYASFVQRLGASGLYYTKMADGLLSTGIAKFFDEDTQKALITQIEMKESDLLFVIGDVKSRTHQALDHLRRKVAKDRNMIDQSKLEFLWVIDFPLFTWNEEENRIEAEHHPFTSPLLEDLHLMETEPLKTRSSSYDLVLNGYEVASGSQRIHNGDLQEKIFNLLNLSQEDISKRFGFFIESLKYGTPPHAGIALGLDRLIMIMAKTDNIRDVVAFPKTQKAFDLMMEAPSSVTFKQLDELQLEISE